MRCCRVHEHERPLLLQLAAATPSDRRGGAAAAGEVVGEVVFVEVVVADPLSLAGVPVHHGLARLARDVAAPDELAVAALHVLHHLEQNGEGEG